MPNQEKPVLSRAISKVRNAYLADETAESSELPWLLHIPVSVAGCKAYIQFLEKWIESLSNPEVEIHSSTDLKRDADIRDQLHGFSDDIRNRLAFVEMQLGYEWIDGLRRYQPTARLEALLGRSEYVIVSYNEKGWPVFNAPLSYPR